MAANLNGTFDITPIVLKFIDTTNGVVFFSILIFLVASGYVLSMLLKSGLISNFVKYSEHRRRQRNKLIAEQEKLLTDDFLKEYSDEITYHIKASKLSNYLNLKNKDLDLLTYVLSCRNKERAVRLYKIGQDYLEKDEKVGIYRLKEVYTDKRIKIHSGVGTFLYILINIIGVFPYIYLSFLKIKYRQENFTIPDNLYVTMFFYFIVFFILSFMALWKSLKPTAAKNFLEMEKIGTPKMQKDNIDEVA